MGIAPPCPGRSRFESRQGPLDVRLRVKPSRILVIARPRRRCQARSSVVGVRLKIERSPRRRSEPPSETQALRFRGGFGVRSSAIRWEITRGHAQAGHPDGRALSNGVHKASTCANSAGGPVGAGSPPSPAARYSSPSRIWCLHHAGAMVFTGCPCPPGRGRGMVMRCTPLVRGIGGLADLPSKAYGGVLTTTPRCLPSTVPCRHRLGRRVITVKVPIRFTRTTVSTSAFRADRTCPECGDGLYGAVTTSAAPARCRPDGGPHLSLS